MIRSPSSAPPRVGAAAPWSLRSARVADAESWHHLQRAIYREGVAFVGDGAPSPGALAARLRGLSADQGHVAVAVRTGVAPGAGADAPAAAPPPAASGSGGEVVGWIELQRMTPRRLAHVGWLTIAVAPGWRRRGVGAALMVDGRAWAAAQRLRKLQLHVRAGNAAAIALYRRLGYVVEGVLRDQVAIGDVDARTTSYEDEWIMALDLTGGGA